MKKIFQLYLTVGSIALLLLNACSKEFLNPDPKGTLMEDTYYSNPNEAFAGLVSVYDPVGWQTAVTYFNFGALNAASDDHVAGGGGPNDMETWQRWSNYTLNESIGPQQDYWNRNFTGVSRANVYIKKLEEGVSGLNEALASRYVAEAKFLRAYYYFDLVRLFRNIPFYTEPLTTDNMREQTQVAPEVVYAQIEQDLKDAITMLPPTVPGATEGGRATKGAAQALLGKVYVYQKKWNEAAAQLSEVNGTPGGTSQYGYHLLDDFGDVFRPDNKFHSESIFEIVHSAVGALDWGAWGQFYGNVATVMFGPRGYGGPFYYSGWSFCPITQDLYDLMHKDPRFKATVADVDSIERAMQVAANDPNLQIYERGYMNTGWFIQKYAPLTEFAATNGVRELNYPQNYIEIRLADTYLMEAEALVESGQGGGAGSRAYQLLNAVRGRVDLGPIEATLDHIFLERRKELATEGHRWYDLVRSGRAPAVLGSRGFVAGKHEVLPIPYNELLNTQLEQHEAYK
ncbi:MAG TPA: RagB/SusD family nutrient uptake outer membrane protein [Parapedobacter sp.]|uniref:RagB/SusD family nutrient uptake outer membrane protein n=1 Tax=Parapedobacter sp. TaxID=1958893 RepID=UPI002C887703|nr:RagB/SusD family nutrient uptake outer membrane protein [Parapedobacter sp.]HWK58620.1 RagB/SusD family nutrient uptake outer membrane protein [Parapedobacter sp.]